MNRDDKDELVSMLIIFGTVLAAWAVLIVICGVLIVKALA